VDVSYLLKGIRKKTRFIKLSLVQSFGGDGLQSMYVTHVTVSGTNYSRSQQYTRDVCLLDRHNNNENDDDINVFWKGTTPFNQDFPDIYIMPGHFFIGINHKLHYTEERTKKGHKVFSMDSVCHWIGD
jgi:hypothetical protein